MKNCAHILEKTYCDGSISGYVDLSGIVSNGDDIPKKKERIPSGEYILNPFRCKEPDSFSFQNPFCSKEAEANYMEFLPTFYSREEEEFHEKVNRKRAARRASQQAEDIARSVPWRYFVTLTFSSDCGLNRYSYDDAFKAVELFLKNLRHRFIGFRYICVPEQHKDKAFHFHALIGGCDMTSILKDSGHKKNHKPIYNLSAGWTYGFSTVSLVQKQGAVGRYIAKYLTKDMTVPKGRKRYLASNNIPRTKDIIVRKNIMKDFHIPQLSEVSSIKEEDRPIFFRDLISQGAFTDGIVPDRVHMVRIPVLDRYVYYYSIFGNEDLVACV